MTTPDDAHALREIRERLADVYTPEGIDIWLRSANRNLDGASPYGLLAVGLTQRVLTEVDLITGGMG